MPLRLYDDLAFLWPALSPPSDYAPEAAFIDRVLKQLLSENIKHSGNRPSLLELGAGGGHTLCHLADRFDVCAVDLSGPMLANCRALMPGCETVVGDMRAVRLGRTFDAVLIHDAIDYMQTEADVMATLESAASHLSEGGVVIVAPTYVMEDFDDGAPMTAGDRNLAEVDGSETEVAFVSRIDRVDGRENQRVAADGDEASRSASGGVRSPEPVSGTGTGTGTGTASSYDLSMLIAFRRDGRLSVMEDVHRCGLFARADWRRMIAAAGFMLKEDLSDAMAAFAREYAEVQPGMAEGEADDIAGTTPTDSDEALPWHPFVGVRCDRRG